MNLQINEIEETPVDLYYKDRFIGVIKSHLSFDNIRVQIKKQQLVGCYVMFNNIRIDINKDGRCDDWPKGFFDTFENQLYELL